LTTVDKYLDEFTTLCNSVYVLSEDTPRAMDAIASPGERINARILAAALRQRGAASEAIDATDLIVTDAKVQNTVPLMDLARGRFAGWKRNKLHTVWASSLTTRRTDGQVTC